jgi:cytochrome P450
VLAFLDAWRRYGDTVRFRGPVTLYLLAHPDAVKHVLQDQAANYPRPRFVRDRLQAIVGGGLVGAEGADWIRSRKLAQPAFRRHSLEGYGRQFVEATGEVLDSWAASADSGRPLDVESEMVRVSLANLAASLFQTDWRREVGRAGPAVGEILAFANSAVTSVLDTARLPLPATRRFQRNLELLDAVLYPLVLRRATADDEVGGYRIPAGANIAFCPYVTHRHPGFWDNPEGFEPGRFAPEAARRRHRMAFFPFSGGPRRCIGEGFAQLQLPLVVAMVAQRYRLSLLPSRPAEVEAAVTLRPRAPMLMRVERVA